MIHAGDDDLVARLHGAPEGAGKVQGEGGHVLAEDDLVRGLGAEEVGHGLVGIRHDRFGPAGSFEMSSEIGIALQQAGGDLLRHGVDRLGAGRIVEIDAGPALVLEREGGEAAADALERDLHLVGWFYWFRGNGRGDYGVMSAVVKRGACAPARGRGSWRG